MPKKQQEPTLSSLILGQGEFPGLENGRHVKHFQITQNPSKAAVIYCSVILGYVQNNFKYL